MIKLLVAAASLLVAALGLTGCSTETAKALSCDSYDGVILVVGVHQNQPTATLPSDVACRIKATIVAGGSIGLVAVDGTPSVVVPPTAFDVSANNPTDSNDLLESDYANVLAAVQGATADSDGADLAAALHIAAEAARSATPAASDIVVLDDGLSDRGDINETQPGMTLAEGTDVANNLLSQQALSADSFAGLHFDLYGLGSTVAPQDAISQAQKTHVADTYSSVITAGGGSVDVIAHPASGAGPDTTYTTTPAPVVTPEPLHLSSGDLLTFGVDAIAFTPDKATLVSSSAASKTLAPVADWLTADTSRHATVTGRTSSANPSINAALSRDRARTVVALLKKAGVKASQLTAVGAGYTANPPDRDAAGVLIPGAQALNRVVEIELGK